MPIQLSDHFNTRRLLRFTLPSILMMIFTSVYSVVDGFFISNFIGKTAFASVNLIIPYIQILGGIGAMLGVGGSAYPLYVLRKNAENNTVVLGPEEHLYSTHLMIENTNWIAFADLTEPLRCTAKTRYSQTEAAATVSPLPGGRAEVAFDTLQRAVTAGQSAVFYDGDTVLGGGVICEGMA